MLHLVFNLIFLLFAVNSKDTVPSKKRTLTTMVDMHAY